MNLNEVIRIIREIAVICVVLLVGYRVIDSDFSINLGTLSATDIVALLLALFAVGLSAAFYFKSSDSSNNFYDNMHKFTKDTSVILGQLTEKLNSVDKGQLEVKTRFDRLYNNGGFSESEVLNKEKEKEKEKLVAQNREDLKSTLESLLDKHKINDKERVAFKQQLEQKESQLSESLAQLSEFKSEQRANILRRVKQHSTFRFRQQLKKEIFSFEIIIEQLLRSYPSSSKFKDDLVQLGFIDDTDASTVEDLTDSGLMFFTDIYERTQENIN